MRRYPFVRRGFLTSAIALTLFGLFLIPFALASAPQMSDAPTSSSPEQAVQAAWRQAQEAGAYHFAADIQQTSAPQGAVGRRRRAFDGRRNLDGRHAQMHRGRRAATRSAGQT